MIEKLKVVVLVDGPSIQKWMYLALARVVDAGHSEIVLIIENDSKGIHKSRWAKLFNNLHKIIYFTYMLCESIVYRIFNDQGSRELMAVEDLLPDATLVRTSPIEGKYTDEFSDDTISILRQYNPDVIVRFGFRILKGDILSVARFGVLSFHHGDPNCFRGGPACYWESALNINKTGSILQVLSSDLDGGAILCLGYTATNIYSPFLNYERALMGSVPFLDDALRSMHQTGDVVGIEGPLAYYDSVIYKAPHNIVALKHVFFFMKRLLTRLMEKVLWFDQWVILYGSINELNVRKFVQFKPQKTDRFWADPFLFKRGDSQYVFFEEQVGSSPAHISVGKIVGDTLTDVKPVLIERYHLSYPFIFEHENTVFMIPESSENGSIDLYRCESFPAKWVKIRSIMNGVTAADSTVLFKNGYWWLFSSIREYSGSCPHSSLRLFYSSDLLHGDFIPHIKNPICSDVSQSRPAGRLFHRANDLYRPSQDCSIRYGYAINFNLITVLTISDYRESIVQRIEPNWSNKCLGVHTYNSDSSHVVVDALIKRRRVFGG